MLSTGQNLTGAILKGVDVGTIGTVTDLPASVQEGKLEGLRDPAQIPLPARGGDSGAERKAGAAPGGKAVPGIVIGRELAHSLRVFVGDQVNVVSPFGDLGPAGPQPKSRPFRVAAGQHTIMFVGVDLLRALEDDSRACGWD